MIPDSARYYGCLLSQILDCLDKSINIQRISGASPGFYLINGNLPFYVKYSKDRTGPWSFNFHMSHREQQKEFFDTYGECIMAFVCGRDGIAALSYMELQKIFDANFELQESVSIRRPYKQMYQIKGRNGDLGRKVSRTSFSEILEKYNESPVRK